MSRSMYFICFMFFSFFSTIFFETSLRDYRIKKYGDERICTVLTNGNCGKSGGTIKVSMQKKEYNLSIGRVDCVENYYHIGDDIKILYDYNYDYMILPTEKVELGLYMSILFFMLPLYCLYQLVKPSKKSISFSQSNKKVKQIGIRKK
jgi:hypothetical protein